MMRDRSQPKTVMVADRAADFGPDTVRRAIYATGWDGTVRVVARAANDIRVFREHWIYQVAAKSVLNRPQIAGFQQSTEGVQYRTPDELPRLLESRSVEVNRHGKLSIQRHLQVALSTLWPESRAARTVLMNRPERTIT
jgi:hypothetical protein